MILCSTDSDDRLVIEVMLKLDAAPEPLPDADRGCVGEGL